MYAFLDVSVSFLDSARLNFKNVTNFMGKRYMICLFNTVR